MARFPRMHHREHGQGPALLLVHGFPLHSGVWDRQLELPGIRVVAPDLPGFGRTPPAPGVHALTMDACADALVELLDELGLARVTVGGLSMGGYVALALALRHPERLSGLVLLDTRAEADTAEAQKGREALARAAEREGPAVVTAAMEERLFTAEQRAQGAAAVERYREIAQEISLAGITAALRGMAVRPDRTPDLPRIEVPTLVVVGAEDRITPPAAAETMARAIKHARLEVLPGAGHLACLEQPEHVAALLGDFVREVAAAEGEPAAPQSLRQG